MSRACVTFDVCVAAAFNVLPAEASDEQDVGGIGGGPRAWPSSLAEHVLDNVIRPPRTLDAEQIPIRGAAGDKDDNADDGDDVDEVDG